MITVAVLPFALLPFAVALLVHRFAGRLGAALPPAAATWLLTVLALSVSLTCGSVLSAVAVLSFARLPEAARAGHWSAAVLRHDGGPPPVLGALLGVVVIALLCAAAAHLARAVRATVRTHRALDGFGHARTGLTVTTDTIPTAYAVLGLSRRILPGRIVVSTAMLRALTADERRALLAHESAHLRLRHHLFVHLTEIAAAANPLMRPAAAAVHHSVERWADEAAAREVGDRRLTARALARAALARSGRTSTAGTLAIGDGTVPQRVEALLAPAAPRHWRVPLLLVAGAVGCWAASVLTALHLHDLIELAESAYHR